MRVKRREGGSTRSFVPEPCSCSAGSFDRSTGYEVLYLLEEVRARVEKARQGGERNLFPFRLGSFLCSQDPRSCCGTCRSRSPEKLPLPMGDLPLQRLGFLLDCLHFRESQWPNETRNPRQARRRPFQVELHTYRRLRMFHTGQASRGRGEATGDGDLPVSAPEKV